MIVAASTQGRVEKGKPGGGGGVTLVGHNPTTFPAIYNAGSTPAASTITVGIISDGNMTQPLKDLSIAEAASVTIGMSRSRRSELA